jgi:lipoprotein-anchoring transpeptidase ErfK/SrfK
MNNYQRGPAPHPNPAQRTLHHTSPARRRRRRRQRMARRILAWGIVAAVGVALIVGIPKLLARVPAAAQSYPQSSASSVPASGFAASSAPASSSDKGAVSQSTAESGASSVKNESNFVCSWDTAGQAGYDYLLAVNRVGNCVTVFSKDADGNYTVPYKAMISSSGEATPVGTYNTIEKYRWRFLQGDVYGQYATRITGHILFHSVPYYSQNINDLEYEEFNKLGTAASLGCIRLQVADAKWIYDNCPVGTPTVLYDDAECPGPLGKPDFPHIDTTNEALRGWDPTDPDDANPWKAA